MHERLFLENLRLGRFTDDCYPNDSNTEESERTSGGSEPLPETELNFD